VNMLQFTVIGIWDTGLIFREQVNASDSWDAVRAAASSVERDDARKLQILGAIPGHHDLIPVGEETDRAAYAIDLLD
jgi:hypothetical protein